MHTVLSVAIRAIYVSVLLITSVGIVITMPSKLVAQLCIGSPVMPGQFGIEGGVSFSDGATGFTADVSSNLDGPIALLAGVGILDVDNFDKNVTTFAIGGVYELPVEGFSACPVIGVGYGTWGDRIGGVDFDASQMTFPLGLGVGGRVGEETATFLIPHAEAGLFFRRVRFSSSQGSNRFTESDTETEFYVSGGATLSFGQAFLQARVSKTTGEDSDAVIGLSLGLRF